jgi:magnesium-transporting ATPase (P-type)
MYISKMHYWLTLSPITWSKINIRENRRGSQALTIRRHRQHWTQDTNWRRRKQQQNKGNTEKKMSNTSPTKQTFRLLLTFIRKFVPATICLLKITTLNSVKLATPAADTIALLSYNWKRDHYSVKSQFWKFYN